MLRDLQSAIRFARSARHLIDDPTRRFEATLKLDAVLDALTLVEHQLLTDTLDDINLDDLEAQAKMVVVAEWNDTTNRCELVRV